MDDEQLQRAVREWLEQRSMTIPELVEEAVRVGLLEIDVDEFEAAEVVDSVISSDDFWVTGDDVVVLTASLVDTGMTFTHRITAAELDAGEVLVAPDLTVLRWNTWAGLELDGGGQLEARWGGLSDPSVLTGPPEWLDAFAPGDLLAFSRRRGRVFVSAVADVGDGAAEIEALGSAAGRWIGDGRGEEETAVVMESLARDPSRFRSPVPPVGELMEAAGLERRGFEWGWAGQEWRTRQEAFTRNEESIRRRNGFGPCCDHAFDRVNLAWSAHLDGSPIDPRSVVADLGHSAVARAFVEQHSSTLTIVEDFARVLADVGGRRSAPAHALLGLTLLRASDVLAAERAFEDAVALDPDCAVAAGDLAVLKLDRGDLSRAHAIALHDDLDPELAEWIGRERARQDALRPKADRNDPCPCGSGKKFKRCCAIGARLRLAQRVPLVLHRLAHFATGPEHQSSLLGLAISAADIDGDLPASIRRFVDDPFLIDVAIHEGGLGDEYLEERAPLLPDDEHELLHAVLDAPRRLWEIVSVDPGEGLELRDTRTGDVVEVVEHSGSEGRAVGELLLARAATAAGEQMLFGVPIVVPLRERDRVLTMLDDWLDADTLAAWFGSLHRPPSLQNREGEDIVLRRSTVVVADDLEVVIQALDEAYRRDGDELTWHETTTVDGGDEVIRGTIRFLDDALVVESNAEARQDRLLDTILGLLDAYIIDEENGDDFYADDFDDDEADGEAGLLDLREVPDEIRAAIEQQMAVYEERWVDEAIPALGGVTPRQALDDPTRREDLFALLREMRSMAPPPGGFGMSVDRLEQLLGIGH